MFLRKLIKDRDYPFPWTTGGTASAPSTSSIGSDRKRPHPNHTEILEVQPQKISGENRYWVGIAPFPNFCCWVRNIGVYFLKTMSWCQRFSWQNSSSCNWNFGELVQTGRPYDFQNRVYAWPSLAMGKWYLWIFHGQREVDHNVDFTLFQGTIHPGYAGSSPDRKIQWYLFLINNVLL